jgi:hypothetical protein
MNTVGGKMSPVACIYASRLVTGQTQPGQGGDRGITLPVRCWSLALYTVLAVHTLGLCSDHGVCLTRT